jgi:hypothetical protein
MTSVTDSDGFIRAFEGGRVYASFKASQSNVQPSPGRAGPETAVAAGAGVLWIGGALLAVCLDEALDELIEDQWAYGPQIPASQARPGDLVFFAGSDGTKTAPGHVGIVTGHDTMIDAPYTGQVVRQESFSGSTDLVGFTRP